jgi:hypothetical protein
LDGHNAKAIFHVGSLVRVYLPALHQFQNCVKKIDSVPEQLFAIICTHTEAGGTRYPKDPPVGLDGIAIGRDDSLREKRCGSLYIVNKLAHSPRVVVSARRIVQHNE